MKNQFSNKIIRSILNVTPTAEIIIPNCSVGEGAARVARMHKQIRLFPESLFEIVQPKQNNE